MRAVARSIVVAFMSLAPVVFGLRDVGFREGGSTRDVTVHVDGLDGMTDIALASADNHVAETLMQAGKRACKPPGGALKQLAGYRGPKAVFINEVVPSGRTFRFRWDCRLSVLRMADQ